MEFFDFLIDETLALADSGDKKEFSFICENPWKDEGHSGIILQRDCAYELKGTGFNLVSLRDVNDSVVVFGEDLPEIRADRAFSRISVISIESQESEQQLHDLIKKIEYVKYHCFPEGYMMRSTSSSCKEAVRVSKSAIGKGITFQKIGSLLVERYKKIPGVKGVTVIFVTDKTADYTRLNEISEKSTAITKALNHIMESVNFDCESCNLKPLCDEVEGMRELHFKTAARMGG